MEDGAGDEISISLAVACLLYVHGDRHEGHRFVPMKRNPRGFMNGLFLEANVFAGEIPPSCQLEKVALSLV